MICGVCHGQIESGDDIVAHPSNGRVAHELCYRNLARQIDQNTIPAETFPPGRARNRRGGA